MDAVEAGRRDHVPVLPVDVVLKARACRIEQPQPRIRIIVVEVEAQLVRVRRIGVHRPLRADSRDGLIVMKCRVRHGVRHGRRVVIMHGVNEVLNRGPIHGVLAAPVRPRAVDDASRPLDVVLMPPHPVIQLESVW